MSTKVIASGRFRAASDAMIDCNSSDFPAPVVPATRACGPSLFMSMAKAPSTAAPIGATVVRPPAAQAAATDRAEGGSSSRTSSSRSDVGSATSASSRLTSRIGAIARATRSAHTTLTWSARTSSTRSP